MLSHSIHKDLKLNGHLFRHLCKQILVLIYVDWPIAYVNTFADCYFFVFVNKQMIFVIFS